MEQHALSGYYEAKHDEDGLSFFIASTEQKNRKGFGVRTRGISLDNFKANPIFVWSHDASGGGLFGGVPDIENVLGRVPNIRKSAGELIIGVEWAQHDRAQLAAQLVQGGFLNTVSIGMSFNPENISQKKGDDGAPFPMLEESDLMEVSLTMVPANPGARKLALAILSNEVPELPESHPPLDKSADPGLLLEGVRNTLAAERLRSIWR